MDQDATWYGCRPRMRRHCVTWGLSSPKGTQSPQFSAHDCCGQTAGWIKMLLGTEVGLGPGDIVLGGDPAPPKKGYSIPTFRPMSIVAKRLHGSRCHIVRRYRPRPRPHCVSWEPSFPLPPRKGHSSPLFGRLWPNGRPSQLLLSTCKELASAGNLFRSKACVTYW